MNYCVEVHTHCRLHFGLTSLGHDLSRPQFGGVGIMIDAPGITLRVKPDQQFDVSGPLMNRVEQFATTIALQWRLPSLPEVHIEIEDAPREHVGLGTGTQLALAVAAGLGEALGFAWRDPLRLAQLTRRGRRSAIGTYGFLQGGLIVDGGHCQGEPLGQLAHRSDFPSNWRFVLFIPTTQTGCAGSAEERAFATLPPVPLDVTAQLESIANTELVPAVANLDFNRFSDALYRYGSLAGNCFSAVQGGSFCSAETAALIDWLRGQGIAGVGQSSWGPTVFALAENQRSAEELVREFASYPSSSEFESLIATPANQGATVRVQEA
jgi:beta-RFAP synthase